MNNQNFYAELPSFAHFEELTNDAIFKPVPENWSVVITDIKNSTQSIEAGKYRDVNTLGASCIIVVQNCLKDFDFPYVFGGDGASLLIPNNLIESVIHELFSLKNLARKNFGMELRIGVVSIQEIKNRSSHIEVAKFNLVGKKSIGIFRGGGLALADKLIKSNSETFERKEENFEEQEPNLEGLSCRWQPIPSEKGNIVSLLILSREGSGSKKYEEVLGKLNSIFDGKIENANPVNLSQMHYKSPLQCFLDEKRYHKSLFSFSFIFKMLGLFVGVLIFKFKIPPIIFNPKKYFTSMKTHSDYKKFDDMLRLTIDCSNKELEALKSFLEELFLKGKIFYGMNISDHTLMTCFVKGVNDGEHIHFIDGGDGGYALAAKQLKSQMEI